MATLKDKDWLRKSFLMTSRGVTNQAVLRSQLTNAEYKFVDTTLGGSFEINPTMQFCPSTDPIIKSKYSKSNGLGRYYSKAYNDREQLIHIRAGVPAYNSIGGFLTSYYNTYAANLANKGRAPGFMFAAGELIGTLITLPIQPIIWMGKVMNFLGSKKPTSYYYLKPAMPLYWSSVSTMVNTIIANKSVMGRLPYRPEEESLFGRFDPVNPVTGDLFRESLQKHGLGGVSDIFLEGGGVDIYSIATRAQRRAISSRKAIEAIMEGGGDEEMMHDAIKESYSSISDKGSFNNSFNAYLKTYFETDSGRLMKEDKHNQDLSLDSPDGESILTDTSFSDFLQAELEDGSQFITVKVNHTGTCSESFNTTTGESGLSSTMNSTSATNKDRKFNIAGKTGVDIVDGMLESVGSFFSGVGQSVGLGGLEQVLGSAFVDIPDVVKNSTVSLSSTSYRVELRSAYGDMLSQIQRLIIPTCQLLALAMPRSAGAHAYTDPTLVEVFDKGRAQVRLGVVTSFTISRGEGNLGWTTNGEALGVNIDFTITDLSKIIHMPIITNFSNTDGVLMSAAGAIGDTTQDVVAAMSSSNFDDENKYTDYMAVLSSLSLTDQIYPTNRIALLIAQRKAMHRQWSSPANLTNSLIGSDIGQVAAAIFATSINSRATELSR